MLTLILALSFAEPMPPKGIPWPGGIWKHDGKTYPAGAFIWIKQADQDAYLKAHDEWERANPSKVLAKRTAFKWDFCNLAASLRKVDWAYDDGKITGTSPLAAYNGTGSFSASYGKDSRKIEVVLNKVDVAKFLNGINLKTPIEVNGICGKLSGTIDGDKGYFIGTEMRTSGVTIRSVDLTIDFKTGAYTSTADTSFGKQVLKGQLRVAK